jgi:hypothetical protein
LLSWIAGFGLSKVGTQLGSFIPGLIPSLEHSYEITSSHLGGKFHTRVCSFEHSCLVSYPAHWCKRSSFISGYENLSLGWNLTPTSRHQLLCSQAILQLPGSNDMIRVILIRQKHCC